ncbi:MAG: zinc-binding alcohol dehydrogenase [Armatimonadetes bacterium]|nr:zinc-binding alcohol dehydrogenase [Armatimonadota bacterium]
METPSKALRVLLREPNVVEMEEVNVRPPGPGEILVQGIASTISTGTELTLISGQFPQNSAWSRYARYPMPLGYSLCGRVVSVGDGVSAPQLGELVVGYWPHAQYVTVPASSVIQHVPAGLDVKVASTFALGLIAMNGIRRAQLELGESVVVYGLGVLGQLCVAMARLCGCRPVIGVDLYEHRRQIAQSLGAHLTLDGSEDVPGRVKDATDGRGADVLFEVTGNPEVIESEFRVLRRFGRAVILSSPRGPSQFDFHDFCNSPSITIIGAHNGSTPQCETVFSQWTWPRNCKLYFELAADGEIPVGELITHVFPAVEAPEVYRRLIADRGWAGFVVLDWGTD